MIEIIEYKNKTYPLFQAQGFSAQFAFPFAVHVCKGIGVDIGCNRMGWKFPGAHAVDPAINEYSATNFPWKELDYVFSSHCLEHLDKWVDALDYWTKKLKSGGTLFLYLPDYSQEYWRPWNNRKHVSVISPQIIVDYMSSNGYEKIFSSQRDLNDSFMVMGEKK
jgi:predicted SAM-dependent methyltransferase